MMTKHRRAWAILGLCLLPALAGGCALFGIAANAMPRMVRARYAGLAKHSVGVMVWADRGVRTDWPAIQLDLAAGVQRKLQDAEKTDKRRELEGATFPVDARSMVRYQQDYPQIEGMNVVDVAPKLGVSRLIYVELVSFQTRSDLSLELFKGNATATVKVVEISQDPATGKKTAKVALEVGDLAVTYPKKGPSEGSPGLSDYAIYAGTVNELTTAVSQMFYEHEEEP